MRVLVACEFSGIVRDAFAARGHDAWSCDILPTERLGNHFHDNIESVLAGGWDVEPFDMMIAFPPCTYLASSGAAYWHNRRATGDQQRAIGFVLQLYNCPISKVCVENPVGYLSTVWRKPDQIINPFQYGDPYRKRTCLWLKNLPTLTPTKIVEPIANWHSGSTRGGKKKDGTRTPSKLPSLHGGWKKRSLTFQGVANAMASQWG